MARAQAYLQIEPSWAPAGAARIHVQTLGACQIQIGSERISPSAETLFSLVVRVVYAPGLLVPRDVLLSALWPGQSATRQRGSLRQALYKLRRMGVVMSMDGEHVRFSEGQIARTFAMERTPENFERDVLQEHEPFGVFLPGFEPRSEELQEFIHACREAVHSDVRRVLVAHLRNRRERADWRGAETMSRWLLQFDPLNEEATLTLAECMALSGGKAQALEMIDRYLDELGPDAGDIRLPASMLRKRLVDPGPRKLSFAPTERHFVGREEELAEVTQAMRRARWHDGSAYLIYGPAGMGKTRLTLELAKVATIEGMLQLRYSCRESDSARPLSLALELVSELLAAPGALGCAPETLAHLRRLVGEEPPVFGPDGAPLPREPLPSPAAIRRGIADIVAAVGEEKPIFLVVDDVHWLDRQSWDVLADLVERAEATRVCVVMTSRQAYACGQRPERVPGRLRILELNRLSEAQACALARAILADNSTELTEQREQRLLVLCEGSPLYLRCLIEFWLATGDSEAIPPSLASLIAQRIKSYSSSAQSVLRAVVGLGRHCTLRSIERVLEVDALTIHGAINELESSDAIRLVSGVVVCHELVGRSAMNLAGPIEKCLLNRRIAETLMSECNSARRAGTLMTDVLKHLIAANDTALLTNFLLKFGDDLVESEGVQLVSEASEICERSASDRMILDRLHSLKLTADQQFGRFTDEVDSVSKLQRWAARKNWDNDEASIALPHLEVFHRTSDTADRDTAGVVAASIAGSPAVALGLRISAAELAVLIASNTANTTLATRAYECVPKSSGFDEASTQLEMMYHTVFGDVLRARELALQRFKAGMEESQSLAALRILENCGVSLSICGDWQQAYDAFVRCTHLIEKESLGARRVFAHWRLSHLMLDIGSLQDAEKWAQQLYQDINNAGPTYTSIIHKHMARMAIEHGDSDGAARFCRLSTASQRSLQTPKSYAYQSALEIASLMLRGEAIDEALLQVAIGRQKVVASMGTCDFTTAAIGAAIASIRGPRESLDFLDEYLEIRRDRSSLLPRLVELHEANRNRLRDNNF